MRIIMQLHRKIREQKRLLEEMSEAVQTANYAKARFVANMSHEMRTPLNAIIGLSSLNPASEGNMEANRINLEKINNAGISLLGMVNDILSITEMEAGNFELHPAEYELPELINDVAAHNVLLIGDKPVMFVMDLAGTLPSHLYGDKLRVKQILNILLSNAIKYTIKGSVELCIGFDKPDSPGSDFIWLTVRVKDSGSGIKSEDMENLFTAYTGANNSGFGLSFLKRLVAMMDGTINAESEYGKGSIFTARFRQKLAAEDTIGNEVADSLKKFRYSERKRNLGSRMTRPKMSYARILLVDDIQVNLDVAKGMLKPYGIQIDCVNNGQAAIDAIRSRKTVYKAVFMDYMMPGMDGMEAARIIREEIGTDYARTIPIIALTANTNIGNEEMFLGKGFQAFLTKPLDMESLDSVLHKYVRDIKLEKIIAENPAYMDIRSGKERREDTERRDGTDRRTFGKKIPGIDLKKGVERFGGDVESFIQVLRSYVQNTPLLLDQIRNVTMENLDDYIIAVHGIKGSSRSICANLAGTKAEVLEKKARDGDFESVVSRNAAFIETVEKLIDDMDKWLALNAPDSDKPKKDKPDNRVISKLLSACRNYDMDGVDEAMEEIEEYDYNSDGELVAWLRKNVDKMNFSVIIDKLSE